VSPSLKKLAQVPKFGLLFAIVPILVPVSAVTAQQEPVVTPTPTAIIEQVAITASPEIVTVADQPLKIELAQSTYQAEQAKKKLAAIKIAVAAPAVATVGSPDPGAEVKREWVQKAANAFSVDWKVLEAVWQVESGQTWYTSRGSSAGARGPCQFMPGTWRGYAMDGNGDGVKDAYDARDCLFGAAKLLATNGAANGNVYQALLRYNHADWYVRKVLALAGTK
jgi:membrane-bound lytic murein transglycosylase B